MEPSGPRTEGEALGLTIGASLGEPPWLILWGTPCCGPNLLCRRGALDPGTS